MAKPTRKSMILPSFFEGRGTCVMASNCSHTKRGSRLEISDIGLKINSWFMQVPRPSISAARRSCPNLVMTKIISCKITKLSPTCYRRRKKCPPYGRTSSGHAESEGGITDFSQNRIAIGNTATGGSLYRLPSRTARRSSGGTAICGCEEKTLILIFTTFDCDRNHSVVRTKIRFMLWISE